MSNTPLGFPQGFPPVAAQTADPSTDKKAKKQKKAKSSSSTPATESTKRVRGLLAILLALLGGALVFSSLNANESAGKVFVLRATSAILPLTPIEESQLEAVEMPIEAVEPGALKGDTAAAVLEAARSGDGTVVVGRYALYPILANQQIRLKSMLTADAQLGAALGAEERLVTINVPLERGVAGLVRTGDRVDIYSVTSTGTSELLAGNIEVVMAAPSEDVLRSSAEENPGSDPLTRIPDYPVPAMYVVRVPVSLVPGLVAADSSATLYLAYRSATALPAADTCIPTPTTPCPVEAPTSPSTTVPADK
jgi:Flp pilus assembly protein CpaB